MAEKHLHTCPNPACKKHNGFLCGYSKCSGAAMLWCTECISIYKKPMSDFYILMVQHWRDFRQTGWSNISDMELITHSNVARVLKVK